ncbi:alpha/beta hydrolase family protein [Rhodococcus sp. ACT016]|uniref:alpha/beta hydrolase family protein n=1 Tax=Rhodococcus sp. ACT016 TaxID=3134808 RepID=UPI003D2BB525
MANRGIRAACALASVLIAGSLSTAAPALGEPAGPNPTVVLPEPSGGADVGTTTLHLVDSKRADPWRPDQPRELMVTVTYPAADTTDHPLAHYVSTEAAPTATRGLAAALHLPIDVENLLGFHTNAHTGAPVVATADRGLPVVLFSPGAGVPRILGTGEAEDLASRGYVVVSIDHTYEALAVEFPGGRIAEGIPSPEDPAQAGQWVKAALEARVADTRFVLDELTALADGENPDAEQRTLPDGLGRALDLSHVGMFGHSLGGFTAAEAMARDTRIDAGVNLDGMVGIGDEVDLAATRGLDRPLLLMSSQQIADMEGVEPSWTEFWDDTRGWARELVLSGSGHYSFTDLETLVPPIAATVAPDMTGQYIGTIAPDRATLATREYVAAMFDRFLRHRAAPLLDGPNAEFPEVRYVR